MSNAQEELPTIYEQMCLSRTELVKCSSCNLYLHRSCATSSPLDPYVCHVCLEMNTDDWLPNLDEGVHSSCNTQPFQPPPLPSPRIPDLQQKEVEKALRARIRSPQTSYFSWMCWKNICLYKWKSFGRYPASTRSVLDRVGHRFLWDVLGRDVLEYLEKTVLILHRDIVSKHTLICVLIHEMAHAALHHESYTGPSHGPVFQKKVRNMVSKLATSTVTNELQNLVGIRGPLDLKKLVKFIINAKKEYPHEGLWKNLQPAFSDSNIVKLLLKVIQYWIHCISIAASLRMLTCIPKKLEHWFS